VALYYLLLLSSTFLPDLSIKMVASFAMTDGSGSFPDIAEIKTELF
jgi:hypothetical protein